MNDILRQRPLFLLLIVAAVTAGGCTELRGRRRIREGTRLYREGNYPAARDAFASATELVPQIPQAWLGEALSCRQLITPGATTPANEQAVNCALAALGEVRSRWPQDNRGETLYVQTLFDADRFPALVSLYEERLKKDPSDLAAVNGEIQTYTRWNHLEESLAAYQRKAALLPNDAEAQYAVGVFIWQQLFQRGGGPDKAAFDPRPDPNAPASGEAAGTGKGKAKKKKEKHAKGKHKTGTPTPATPGAPPEEPHKPPPLFSVGDITGTQRAALADLGVKYLQRALALRPQYREAMVYLNLLLRQKAMAYFTRPSLWQACIDEAEKWRLKVEAMTAAAGGKPGPGGAGGAGAAPATAPNSATTPGAPAAKGDAASP
jgi:tetratricopeptide (TPR) repeat protein